MITSGVHPLITAVSPPGPLVVTDDLDPSRFLVGPENQDLEGAVRAFLEWAVSSQGGWEATPAPARSASGAPAADVSRTTAAPAEVTSGPEGTLGPALTSLNPLTIAGGVGSGKSQLVQDLLWWWQELVPGSKARAETSLDFARAFREAEQLDDVEAFREPYEVAGLLILEDLQRVGERWEVQREIVRLLQVRLDHGLPTIFTMLAPTGSANEWLDALTSRLAGGLVTEIEAPGPQTRLAWIRGWTLRHQRQIDEEAAELLAQQTGWSISQLAGTLTQLHSAVEQRVRLASDAVAPLAGQADPLSPLRSSRVGGAHLVERLLEGTEDEIESAARLRLRRRKSVLPTDDWETVVRNSRSGESPVVERDRSTNGGAAPSAITLADVEAAIRQSTSGEPVTIADIVKATARQLRLKVADVRGKSRRTGIMRARSIAMYLCRELTELSFERIGEYFSHRDHTTVIHACRKIESLLADEAELQAELEDIRSALKTLGARHAS